MEVPFVHNFVRRNMYLFMIICMLLAGVRFDGITTDEFVINAFSGEFVQIMDCRDVMLTDARVCTVEMLGVKDSSHGKKQINEKREVCDCADLTEIYNIGLASQLRTTQTSHMHQCLQSSKEVVVFYIHSIDGKKSI